MRFDHLHIYPFLDYSVPLKKFACAIFCFLLFGAWIIREITSSASHIARMIYLYAPLPTPIFYYQGYICKHLQPEMIIKSPLKCTQLTEVTLNKLPVQLKRSRVCSINLYKCRGKYIAIVTTINNLKILPKLRHLVQYGVYLFNKKNKKLRCNIFWMKCSYNKPGLII